MNSIKFLSFFILFILSYLNSAAQPCTNVQTAAGNDKSICQGAFTTIGCDPNLDYCYRWIPEDGLEEPQSALTKAAPTQTTTYTLHITDGNGNYLGADEVTVTVSSVSVTTDGPDGICKGENATIAATPLPDNQQIFYKWSTGDETPTITVSPNETTEYTVTITNLENCRATATHTVNVNEIDQTVFNPEKPVVCSSNPKPVKITITNHNAALNYNWSNGANGSVIFVSQPGVFHVTVSDNFGCSRIDRIEVLDIGNPDVIKELFDQLGFMSFPVAIDNEEAFQGNAPSANRAQLTMVDNHAELFVDMVASAPEINVADEIESFLAETPEFSGHGWVTKNEDFCAAQDLFNSIQNDFNNQELAYWAHIWRATPQDEFGNLLVLGRSPVYNTNSPVDGDHREFVYTVHSNAKSGASTYSYDTKNKQLADLTFFHLMRTHLEDKLMDIFSGSEPEEVGDPCWTENTGYFIAPTGMPIKILGGTIVRFSLKSIFADVIDSKAVTGFTDNTGIYAGHGNRDNKTASGYKNIFDKNHVYNFDIAGLTNPVEVRTGFYVPGFTTILPNQGSYELKSFYSISYHEYLYPGTTPINEYATGVFNEYFIQLTQKTDPKPYHVFLDNLEDIPFFNSNNPFSVQYDPENALNIQYDPEIRTNGWVFSVPDPNQPNGFSYIFAAYYNSAPNELQYWRFVNCPGIWVPFDPPATPSFDANLLGFILLAIYETPGHTKLEAVGFVPIVGEPADAINGIWYIAEGNYWDGVASLLCTVPFFDIEIKAGRYILKLGNNGKEAGKIVTAYNGASGKVFFEYKWIPLLARIEQRYNITARGAAKAKKLLNWLEQLGNGPIKKQYNDSPDLVLAWSLLDDLYESSNTGRTLDQELIVAINNILNDPDVLELLGNGNANQGINVLMNIIIRNSWAPCTTCTPANAGNIHLQMIGTYIENVQNFVHNWGNLDGAGTLISLMQNGQQNQIDAIAHIVRYMKDKNPANVNSFEFPISELVEGDCAINNVGDIFITGKYIELKSWKQTTIDNLPSNSGFKNQFLAYLQISDLDDFAKLDYSFDKMKLVKSDPNATYPNFNSTDEAVEYIKTKFKTLFLNQTFAQQMFDSMGQGLKDNLGIVVLNDLINLANNPSSSNLLYSFIKVE